MVSWPAVPLGEVLAKSDEWVPLEADAVYREVTVRLWGKGVAERRAVPGREIKAAQRLRVRAGQFILSRIDARNGAFGLVPPELDGAVVSGDFPTFAVNESRLLPEYLSWLSKTEGFIDLCRHASEGTTNRVRLKEDKLLATPIALPPLAEQRRVVGRVDAVAGRRADARRLRAEAEADIDRMLFGAYSQIAADAPRRPLREVAPLVRRPAVVDPAKEYPGVSVRSFGRGTFHNPPQAGGAITWEKPHEVHAGDLLVSNIKAWEGALAVAGPADHGRYGSHRYLTFTPVAGVATARFVCFHLLTPYGLFHVGEASPGSADRNRTLNARAMLDIPVPVPAFDEQLWFDAVQAKADALRALQAATAADLDALLPAVLAKAFAVELSGGGVETLGVEPRTRRLKVPVLPLLIPLETRVMLMGHLLGCSLVARVRSARTCSPLLSNCPNSPLLNVRLCRRSWHHSTLTLRPQARPDRPTTPNSVLGMPLDTQHSTVIDRFLRKNCVRRRFGPAGCHSDWAGRASSVE